MSKLFNQTARQSAIDAIEQAAERYLQHDPNLSREQAVAKAIKADPRLYEQYLAENPAQTGRA